MWTVWTVVLSCRAVHLESWTASRAVVHYVVLYDYARVGRISKENVKLIIFKLDHGTNHE